MNRREALNVLGAGLVLSQATPLPAGEAPRPRWKSAIGLNGFQSSSAKYGKIYPIWEVLDFASSNKFDGVELVPNWPPPLSNYPGPNDRRAIRALRRLFEVFGLQVFSIQTFAAGAFDANPAVRQQWLEAWRNQAHFAKAIGAECIGIWPGGSLGNQTFEQALAHLVATFREVWKIAGDLGLTASFEIEPPFIFNKEEHLRSILEQVPAARTNLDFSHFDMMNGGTGRVSEILQRVGVKNIGYIHLTDCDGTLRDGGTSKHLPCGEGHIDIDATLAILRAGGFAGWIMIDAWETPDPYKASLKGKQAIDRAMARS